MSNFFKPGDKNNFHGVKLKNMVDGTADSSSNVCEPVRCLGNWKRRIAHIYQLSMPLIPFYSSLGSGC